MNTVTGGTTGHVVQAGRIDRLEQHLHAAPPARQTDRWVVGTVPPRAGAFQDRDVAARLAVASAAHGTTVLIGAGSRVLSGLGGVGKTQLAAEHARTLWESGRVDVLVWVNASSRDAILSAYARATAVVDEVPAVEVEEAATRWGEWLAATDKSWLVVLDDLQDPADVLGLWPPHTPTGAVVVTTRRRDAALRADGRQVLEVGLFTDAEAVDFLTQRLSHRPGQAEGARELARELGYLPVALAQAAAYISDRIALNCAGYLVRWRDRHRRLEQVLPSPGGLPDEHHATVATTWSLSVELATGLAPVGVARPLLEIASLLDPNGIPAHVLTTPPVLAHLTAASGRQVDVESASDALSCLHLLNLITYDPDTPQRAVRVHALVQRATRETLTAPRFTITVRVAADALLRAWPNNRYESPLAAIFRANTASLRQVADPLLWKSGVHAVLLRTGKSLGAAWQVGAAVDYYDKLCATAQDILGPDHLDTLTMRHELAHWRGETDDVIGAATALQQVLSDCERLLGTDHVHTVRARRNLAYRWTAARDFTRAAATLTRVVADHERLSGLDHPDTLAARRSLARVQNEAGDIVGEERTLRRVVADCERLLGIDHPHSLAARVGLACALGNKGDAPSAVSELKRLVADHERALGTGHLSTLTARHRLAHWLRAVAAETRRR